MAELSKQIKALRRKNTQLKALIKPYVKQYPERVLAQFFDEAVRRDQEVSEFSLYDEVHWAPGSTVSLISSAFFTVVGDQSGKPITITNMTQPQKLRCPESMLVKEIRFTIRNADIYHEDLFCLTANAYVLWLNMRPVSAGLMFPYAYQVGRREKTDPIVDSITLPRPIEIENHMTFYLDLRGLEYKLNERGSGLSLKTELIGLRAAPKAKK